MKRSIEIPKLPSEVVLEASKLSNAEARFLVSDYYIFQEHRKRFDMQIRHLGDKELPKLLQYNADAAAHMETQITRSLEHYADSNVIGRWCMSHYGVGPVISAGLLAHMAVEIKDKVTGLMVPLQYAGHWWSFAGLNPEKKWEKGKVRPWSADVKQLCYHAGQCFKRVSGKDEAVYGKLYRARKEHLIARNLAGEFAERAKTYITNSSDVKKILDIGMLPAGNLDSQACRYAVKIFLSHLHAVWYWNHFGRPPPKPFAIAILGHGNEIIVPNSEMFPGFYEAYYGRPRSEAA